MKPSYYIKTTFGMWIVGMYECLSNLLNWIDIVFIPNQLKCYKNNPNDGMYDKDNLWKGLSGIGLPSGRIYYQ